MKSRIILIFIFALTTAALPVHARTSGSGVDVSTGVAFTSDSSGLFENPANLRYLPATFAGFVGFGSGELSGEGSLALSGSSFGFGVGGDYIAETLVGTVGLAAGGEPFGLGASIQYDFEFKTSDFDAGFQIGGVSGAALGFVAHGLSGSADSFEAGMGYRNPGRYQIEIDGQYYPADESITADPSLGLYLAPTLAITGGYLLGISPDFGTGGKFHAGLSWWFGKAAFEFNYNVRLDKFMAGLKIRI